MHKSVYELLELYGMEYHKMSWSNEQKKIAFYLYQYLEKTGDLYEILGENKWSS